MGPHAMQPQRRIYPAGHHQLERRRVILHQPAQSVGAGRTGQVKIINDQDPRPIRRPKVVSQSCHHIDRHLTIQAHQLAGILTDPWLAKAISGRLDDGRDEPGRVGHVAGGAPSPDRGTAAISKASLSLSAPLLLVDDGIRRYQAPRITIVTAHMLSNKVRYIC